MLAINPKQFLLNLRLTQAYCECQLQRGNKSDSAVLRSLNPAYGEGRLFTYKPNTFANLPSELSGLLVEWAPDASPWDSAFLGEVLENQLAQKSHTAGLIYDMTFEGKILAVEYDVNIPDGVAAIESAGFVDGMDFPPIDTWFYRVRNGNDGWVLFAWVPQQFIKAANKAIAVHFLDIIHWFDHWAPEEYRKIMESQHA
ncbi:hypothetical protein IC235_21755 [Hymenobacter sp. BT664]|uniref:Uncharacterized protein n=1 Tax=Hymenobacter montanus TaxID=2771359 RepID=A0A927BI84_9BACT|nr:hypothetical protein [Hymenobacter montanus]MBD2770519.1 hypothetical protein [Hymenobacter montanus]